MTDTPTNDLAEHNPSGKARVDAKADKYNPYTPALDRIAIEMQQDLARGKRMSKENKAWLIREANKPAGFQSK